MTDKTAQAKKPIDLVVVTGMAGAGKSVVLKALEDAGYYCVDNLPPELMCEFVALKSSHEVDRIAIAIDVRSSNSLACIPAHIAQLQKDGVRIKTFFLDASTDVLVRRFSETRRKHPLFSRADELSAQGLAQAIEQERETLQDLRMSEGVHIIDTSQSRNAQLQTQIKQLLAQTADGLTIVLQSFGFKRGLPLDANFVFDVRMLPNPYYEPELRALTGCDAPVAAFLAATPAVQSMQSDIGNFLLSWLPHMAYEHRSYVTVAIGCTGGQHRSVYLVERLYEKLSPTWPTIKRHREFPH